MGISAPTDEIISGPPTNGDLMRMSRAPEQVTEEQWSEAGAATGPTMPGPAIDRQKCPVLANYGILQVNTVHNRDLGRAMDCCVNVDYAFGVAPGLLQVR